MVELKTTIAISIIVTAMTIIFLLASASAITHTVYAVNTSSFQAYGSQNSGGVEADNTKVSLPLLKDPLPVILVHG